MTRPKFYWDGWGWWNHWHWYNNHGIVVLWLGPLNVQWKTKEAR